MHHHVLGMLQHSHTTAAEFYEKPLQHACVLCPSGEKYTCSDSNSHQISLHLQMTKQISINLGHYISQRLRYFTRVPYLKMRGGKKMCINYVSTLLPRELIQVSLVWGGIFVYSHINKQERRKRQCGLYNTRLYSWTPILSSPLSTILPIYRKHRL